MRLSTLLKVAGVGVVALAIALIAVVKSIDFNEYKGFLATQVRGATGRELSIAGPLELKLGLVPSVVASGVTFANMDSGSRPDMARAERIEAEVALLPLLSRRVEVRRLVLVNADILLETDAKGRANWNFSAATDVGDQPRPEGAPPTHFDARKVDIRNAAVTWRDGVGGTANTLMVDTLELSPQPGNDAPLAVKFAGSFDHMPFSAAGSIGSLADLNTAKPWPLKLKGRVDDAVVTADGTIAAPLEGTGIDLRLGIQGEELSALLTRLGAVPDTGLPALGPYKVQGRLQDKEGVLGVSELDAALGRRDAALVSAKGSVKDLVEVSGVTLAVTLESDDLAGLSPLAGAQLPSMGPLTASGNLTDGKNAWTIADLKAALGSSEAAGTLTLTLGQRPHLGGSLTASRLAVADFTTPATKPGETLPPSEPPATEDGRLFPDEKLPVDALGSVDADIDLKVETLDTGAATLDGVSTTIHLNKGKLVVEPFHAMLGGGKITVGLTVDGSDSETAQVALDMTARGVVLGQLAAAPENPKPLITGAPTAADISVTGSGASIRAIMADLSGKAVLDIGEGRIANDTVDWAGDTLFQVLGALNPARSETTTALHCAALNLTIRDGIARARDGIAVQTTKVDVLGAGTIDLRTEKLDLGIRPRARDGVGLSLGSTLAEMTRVRGTLANPSVGIDELGTAKAAVSVGAAVATSGLSLLGEFLFDKVTADANPCRTVLEGKKRRG